MEQQSTQHQYYDAAEKLIEALKSSRFVIAHAEAAKEGGKIYGGAPGVDPEKWAETESGPVPKPKTRRRKSK